MTRQRPEVFRLQHLCDVRASGHPLSTNVLVVVGSGLNASLRCSLLLPSTMLATGPAPPSLPPSHGTCSPGASPHSFTAASPLCPLLTSLRLLLLLVVASINCPFSVLHFNPQGRVSAWVRKF